MSLRTLMFSSFAVAVLALGGTLALAPWHGAVPALAQSDLAPVGERERAVPRTDADVRLSFAPIVQAVSPSVVNVYATRIEQQAVGDGFQQSGVLLLADSQGVECARAAQHVTDTMDQQRPIERLDDEVGGAGLVREINGGRVIQTRDHDDGQRRATG